MQARQDEGKVEQTRWRLRMTEGNCREKCEEISAHLEKALALMNQLIPPGSTSHSTADASKESGAVTQLEILIRTIASQVSTLTDQLVKLVDRL